MFSFGFKHGSYSSVMSEKKKRKLPPEKFKRASKMSLKALWPNKGSLNICLNHNVDHFPLPHPEGKAREEMFCQLHQTANKVVNESTRIPPGARRDVFQCKACKIFLCVKCWDTYHQVNYMENEYCNILRT